MLCNPCYQRIDYLYKTKDDNKQKEDLFSKINVILKKNDNSLIDNNQINEIIANVFGGNFLNSYI
jgi:hypothetical protein